MDDGAFAANVRRLTGKETNTEAYQILRGGALGVGPDLGEQTVTPADREGEKIRAELRAVKDKLVSYFKERWAELRQGDADEVVVVVDDAFGLEDDTEPETPLAAPEQPES